MNSLAPQLLQDHGVCISYVHSEGVQEAGIDAGGLFFDWVSTLSDELFDPTSNLGMVAAESIDGTAVVRLAPGSNTPPGAFRFLGRFLGLAFNKQTPVNAVLCPPLCRQLCKALDGNSTRKVDGARAAGITADDWQWAANAEYTFLRSSIAARKEIDPDVVELFFVYTARNGYAIHRCPAVYTTLYQDHLSFFMR